MTSPVLEALDLFIDKYVTASSSSPQLLEIDYDPQWPSACYEKHEKSGDVVTWAPRLRNEASSFSDLERALEMDIHPDLVTFYCRYWSDNLNAKFSNQPIQLLQAWNHDDFVRLQQNLVGHVLMKKRLKHTVTLFIGVTEDDDCIVTLNNQTGEIMLEEVGVLPTQVLASNLAAFLIDLTPNAVN